MKTLLPEINSADKRFHNGNPSTGEQGTRVTDTWLNDVQDRVRDVQAEAHYVLQRAGFKPKAETQTQLYQAFVKIINDNRKSASTSQKGEVRLTSDTGLDSEELGLTAKAGKLLSQAISSVRLALNNYIPLNKRSSAVNSTSTENVATSAAVKTAYDKGVDALNKANTAQKTAEEKLPLSGGKLTGNLSIDNGSNYNSIYHYNTSGKYTLSQGGPDTSPNFYAIAYFNTDGTRENAAFFPKNSSTEFVAYQSWVTDKISDYIPNSKKSNATNSASRDTVATSFAAKTAFDKGVEAKHAADTANDNANGRVSKSGDTMSGHLTIKANGSDYSSMRTYNTAGRHARWESAPESSSHFAAIVNVNGDGAIEHKVLIRKRSGTLAFDEDVTLKAPKSEPVFVTDKIYTNLDAVPDGTSFFGFHSTAKNIPSDWINSNADFNGFQVGASYQKFQIVAATAGDIRIRLNDDGTNWSSWEKFAMISDVKWAILKDKPATATRWPAWSEVTSKPSSFPPSSHNHTWTQITNAPETATRWPTWNEVSSKPQVVQDIRLGAETSKQLGDREWKTHGAGYVVVGFNNVSGDLSSGDLIWLRPIQKNINGTWVTVANA